MSEPGKSIAGLSIQGSSPVDVTRRPSGKDLSGLTLALGVQPCVPFVKSHSTIVLAEAEAAAI